MLATRITDLAALTKSGDPDMPTSAQKSQQHRQLLNASPTSQSPPVVRSGQPPLADSRARCHGHAARRARLARPAFRALLLAGAVAAMLGLPAAAQAATQSAAKPATAAAAQSEAQAAAPVQSGAPAQAGVLAEAAVAAAPTAPSGGVCSVPGIGDIGGLLGFCAQGSSGIIGDLNNICQPSVPTPEPATGGIDALISPPGTGAGSSAAGPVPTTNGHKTPTLYDSYGMAGQSWAAFDLQCSDMASLVGNNIAGVVFDAAKALDRVTITVYQSAAGEGILSWLTGAVDRLVTSLGNAIYFPYLAPVVILGAIWLAWQGLIRKRASRTIEGTLWMVVACAAAIWLIGRPADFTSAGKAISDGTTQALNVAFAKLPAPHQDSCVPLGHADPQSAPQANFNFSSGNSIVDTNANELWTVLVCKPWLDGEFGTTAYTVGNGKPTVVNAYGRQLLWSQAIAANEKPTADVIRAKQAAYTGLAASLKQHDPGTYALFQGKQWTTRLEIGFAALFAALLAGVLVLLIAITLILLKLGFLLLLVAGPFFLIVGTHPGFGRIIALRWGELLIGVLLKAAAIAIVLSVLLYAYSLIMGTSDAVLPWALKILMISLVTVAVFIYRKPFTHLFSAVGYGVIGSRDRADVHLARASGTAARNTVDAATVAVPGFAAYRAARWARRNPAQAAGIAAQVATAGATAGAAGALAGAAAAAPGTSGAAAEADVAEAAPGNQDAGAGPGAGTSPGAGGAAMGRARGGLDGAPGRTPPPLDLPSRTEEAAARSPSGWARAGTNGPLVPSQSRTGEPGSPAQPSGGTARPRSNAPGARPSVPGPRSSVPDPRSSVPGPRSSAPGSWSSTPGSRSSAPGSWSSSPASRSSTSGPVGGHSGNGQSAAGRTAPAIPVRAPFRAAPSSPPPSSQSRAAPPARRPSPPAAPRAMSAPHAAPAPQATPPAVFRGRGSATSGNGAPADEPAGPAPFWLRPLRRRK